MKKTLLLLTILLLIFAAALTAQADDNIILENFEDKETALVWVPVGSTDTLEILNHGDSSVLRADGKAADISDHRRIIGTFSVPCDLRSSKSLAYTVFADNISGAISDCFARTTLYDSVGEQLEFFTAFESGKECRIELDISSWKRNHDIVSIEISVIPDHIDSGIWDGGFYIDDLCAISYPSSEKIDRFSFEDHIIDGGKLEFADDNSYFDLILSGDICTLEFDIMGYNPISADTLRFSIENNSDCEEISVVFSDLETYSKETKLGIDTLNAASIYNIKSTRDGFNRRVQLKFSGSGYIRFNSLGFISTYVGKSYITYGDITSCTLSQDEKTITISGEIDRKYVPEFANCKLMLYALDFNERSQDFDYSTISPIAEHGMSTKFKFTVGNDLGDPRFKKYVVKISTTPSVFVDTPTYIGQKSSSSGNKRLRAGLISSDISDVGSSAAGMTVIDVYLDKLMSESLSGHMFMTAGRNSYYDKNYVSVLDSKISALTDSGTEIALRLLVKNPNSPLIYTNIPRNSTNYLIDIKNETACYALLSSVEFLTDRYDGNKYGEISSFIIGNAVNSGKLSNGAPSLSITDLITSYADTMRLVSLAADNSDGNIKVYASLGNIYRYHSQNSRDNVFDTADFINGLYDYIIDEGSFPWGICIEDISSSESGIEISPDNRELFAQFLSAKAVKSAAQSSPLIFIDIADETGIALEDYIKAIDAGYSGRYIFKSNEAEFAELLKLFNSGNITALAEVGVNIEGVSKATLQNIKTVKRRTINLSDTSPASIMGKHTYYDFNTYTGIGGWRSSFFAGNVRVVNTGSAQLLEVITNKKLYSIAEDMKLAGAGLRLMSDIDLNLSPILSFDITAISDGKSSDDSLGIITRFISEDTIIEAQADIPFATEKTLYTDLSGYENIKFEAMQILVDDSSELITLHIDNIAGHSYEYTDQSLTQAIKDSKGSTDITPVSALNTNIIVILAVILALLLTLAIFFKLVFRKGKQ